MTMQTFFVAVFKMEVYEVGLSTLQQKLPGNDLLASHKPGTYGEMAQTFPALLRRGSILPPIGLFGCCHGINQGGSSKSNARFQPSTILPTKTVNGQCITWCKQFHTSFRSSYAPAAQRRLERLLSPKGYLHLS